MEARLAALGTANLPSILRVVDACVHPHAEGEELVVTEHVARISMARMASTHFLSPTQRLKAENGVALPLAMTIAHHAALSLARMHGVWLSHGGVNLWSLGVAIESGTVLLDAPNVVRHFGSEREDVASLALIVCALVGAGRIADFQRTDRSATLVLGEIRRDAPPELLALIDDVLSRRLSAHDFAGRIERDLSWTLWTPKQVLDELRALVPDAVP